MICVFLDSNILYSRSADFTKARFQEKVVELTDEIEVSDMYTYVKIVIPQVVISELRKRQIDDCADKIKDLRNTRLTAQTIEFPEDYAAICDSYFYEAITRLQSGLVATEIAPYPPDSVLPELIRRVINKWPPFEGKDKQSDKGFKDALIWETVLEYKRKHPKDTIVMYSQDGRLTTEVLEKEFAKEFDDRIHMVRKLDVNSHKQILEKLRELTNAEEERASFLQQTKDEVIAFLKDIPSEILFETGYEFETEGEKYSIRYCSVENVAITNDSEENGVILFEATLKLSCSICDSFGGFSLLNYESNAMVNYMIEDQSVCFYGLTDPEGQFVEYDYPGVPL